MPISASNSKQEKPHNIHRLQDSGRYSGNKPKQIETKTFNIHKTTIANKSKVIEAHTKLYINIRIKEYEDKINI